MAKIINAMGKALAAAKKPKKKAVKLASHPALGTLSGLVKETLTVQSSLEEDVDKTSEHIENIEFAMESEDWKLSAAGAVKLKAQLTAVRKAQKAIAKGGSALRKAAARAQSEMEAARVKDEPSDSTDESEDGDE